MNAHLPPLVDSHAHLDGTQYDQDREDVIRRALENGISHILTVGCDLKSSRASVELASRYDCIYASVGVHPHDATEINDETIEALRQMLRQPKVVALGEIGLDFYRDRSPREVQRQAFRRQIRLAKEAGKPLIVHDRDAHEEVLQILLEEGATEVGGVLHCFSGDLAMARRCMELGFYLSFPATLTYPKNEEARALVRAIPVDRMLVETDCPYLSPQALRGKRNEPALVRHTAEKIAEIKGLTIEDVARVTSRNCFDLFGIGKVDQATRIAYPIRDSLYLNITNRCTNSCMFCPKFNDFVVKGHELRLEREPTAEEVKQAIGDPRPYREVVFCGYGEPLLRLDLVKEIAAWLKAQGVQVRINSDGQANLVHGRNILPELQGLVDCISVSLNAPDAEQYQSLCQSAYGEKGYESMKDFLRQAGRYIPEVIATAVTVPGVDMEACERLAAQLGVNFRQREYQEVG